VKFNLRQIIDPPREEMNVLGYKLLRRRVITKKKGFSICTQELKARVRVEKRHWSIVVDLIVNNVGINLFAVTCDPGC
jgi:hypothetical protein